jgi:DNA polymerase
MSEKDQVLSEAMNFLEYAKILGVSEVTRQPPKLELHNEELSKTRNLEEISKVIGDCKRCKLCSDRTNIVFGVGNKNADLMFIGEGPGRDEDAQGVPFVGRAGQLLTKIIEAMKISRDDVYIANIVKCRPPGNRNPEPDEVTACMPFLIRQAQLIKPKVIVCLGSVASQNLLGVETKITSLRGNFTSWQNIPVMPTYHPAFLLRNPNMKKPVWEDMQKVMEKLGVSPA